ncbi:hypothetical protein L195_g063602, partial [Trifolium pratense]
GVVIMVLLWKLDMADKADPTLDVA